MSKTLLSIVQDILSDMNGDVVNSIFDTEEAEQVARIVVSTHDNLVSKETWASMRQPVKLTPSGDSEKPTHMTLPTNVKELEAVFYDTRKNTTDKKQYTKLKYYYPDDFLYKTNNRDSTSTKVKTVVDPSGIELLITNDQPPSFFTSFDDNVLVFDSWDLSLENTLQESKTQVLAYILPTLALQDTAVPSLPLDSFRMLIEEATSRAQWKTREFQDVKSEQEANKQRRTLSRKNWRVNRQQRYPNYGRMR